MYVCTRIRLYICYLPTYVHTYVGMYVIYPFEYMSSYGVYGVCVSICE
jgi:hypothetical protein